jgi:hypothetical protein
METRSQARRILLLALIVAIVAFDAGSLALAEDIPLCRVAFASALVCQTSLLAICAMLMSWTWRLVYPLLGIGALAALSSAALEGEGAKSLLALAAATATWPLPVRLSGKRLLWIKSGDGISVGGHTHSLRQWFLMTAVIAGWMIIAQRFPSPASDQGYFVTTSLMSFLGFSFVLGRSRLRICLPLYVGIIIVCGGVWMMIAAEAAATNHWTAPPIHGELGSIVSPLDFVTTRLSELNYLGILPIYLVWLATIFYVETVGLLAFRLAGYRVIHRKESDQRLAGELTLSTDVK